MSLSRLILSAFASVIHHTESSCAPAQVSQRAKKRGKTQLGTLGAGNHYVEVQVSALSRHVDYIQLKYMTCNMSVTYIKRPSARLRQD